MVKKIFMYITLFAVICFSYTNKKMEEKADSLFIPISLKGKNIVKEQDKNFQIKKNSVYKLKNKLAIDLLPILNGISEAKIKGIDNFLVITGTDNEISEMCKLIEKLDVEKQQVLLKLNIIDTSKNLFDRLGFNWKLNKNFSFAGVIAEFLGGNLSFSNLLTNNSRLLDVDIDALKENGELILKSSPNIVVLDGDKGIFKVTDESIFEIKNSENKNSNIISREAGIILEVEPKIKKDYIQIKLKAEVSNFKSKEMKKQNIIETVINIENNKSMFIGGATSIVKDDTKSKTPILGDIPIIGSLFTYQTRGNVQREIYMELEAKII
ncbi:hypothetical protein QQA45_03200 [Sneathia sanguinegens]|uniref:Type II/III secretion system secretin-like domain-containing protein n=1 Tax=Sneathia sanguinegens TaxID=40543 RepID=A0ABT7HJ29_9FUSO|nr:hypothetical protein [Sneathia sanguinegens]MDK9580522.1 hypothetical protein [Sneathia sanguinegens]